MSASESSGSSSGSSSGPRLPKWSPLRWVATIVIGLLVVAGIVISAGTGAENAPGAGVASPPAPSPSPRQTVCDNQSPALLPMKQAHDKPFPMTIDPDASYKAELTTSCGTMLIRLDARRAPIAVNNFIHLAKEKFYLGLVFHRIDPSIGIIQTGDPGCPTDVQDCGTGGPGYTIDDEFPNGLKPKVGTVAMASAGTPNSSGSQFEIVASKEGLILPPERTIFGQLVGAHSLQVAQLILSTPTKRAPNAPPSAPEDFPDGEYVYITKVDIVEHR